MKVGEKKRVPNLGMLRGGGGGGVGTARQSRPADTAAEPNHRNLTGRAEPPPKVPPVHSV